MKKLFIFILSLMTSFILFAEELHVFKMNGKYGYFDEEMKVKIQPQYDKAEEFVGDYAIVATEIRKEKFQYSVINKENKIVDSKLDCSEELLLITENLYYNNWNSFLYNIKTKKDYNCQFARGEYIYSGEDFYIPVEKNNREVPCYITLDGNDFNISGEWLKLYPMKSGMAFAVKKNFDQLIIDEKGNEIVTEVANAGYNFSEGFLPVETSKRSGYISNKGEFVIQCKFYTAEFNPPNLLYPFNEGVAVVQQKKDEWYIFDNHGKYIMLSSEYTPMTSYLRPSIFSNGRLLVSKADKNRNKKYGYLNKQGKEAIPCIYTEESPFENGYAMVVYNNEDGIIDKNGKFYASSSLNK